MLSNSFDEQYSKRGLLTAPHTAMDLISNGVTVQEWIPVTERLPEKPTKCLVYTKRGEYGGYEITYYNEGFYLQYSNVTHWMPLPEPPAMRMIMGHKCDGCRYKSEHQEMMFRPFGVCTKELNLIDAEKAYNADKCHYKKTNADRIRAMSDEELENVIRAISIGYEPWCDHHCKMQGEDNCNICLKKWLQQPAEGEWSC